MSKRDNLIIDWALVCQNLRTHYKPLTPIAKEVFTDWQHINRLARGDVLETGFSIGVRLLDLHLEHVPEKHKEILINDV